MPKILKFSQVMLNDQDKVNIDIITTHEKSDSSNDAIDPKVYSESIIETAKQQADEIISEASRIAESTYAELDETVANAKREAFEQGKTSGYMEGYNEGMAQAADLREKAEQTYNNALSERVQLLNTVEPEIIELVVKILNKLIPDIITVNPQVILYLVKKGLSESSVTGKHRILVSEDDFDTVNKSMKQLSSFIDASSQLEIAADASLKKSDCIIETPFGNIDCGLTQQYNSLKKNLYYMLNNR